MDESRVHCSKIKMAIQEALSTRARFIGCLVGLAVGDALGSTNEFKPRGTFEPIKEMVGGGPFELNPGEWTDDTSMALCLTQSLIERNGFDPADQMEKYVKWWNQENLEKFNRKERFQLVENVLGDLHFKPGLLET